MLKKKLTKKTKVYEVLDSQIKYCATSGYVIYEWYLKDLGQLEQMAKTDS